MLELYHNDMSSCSQKARLVLAEKELDWQGHHMDLRKGETRTPEYMKLNPMGVVPTLIDDGTVIIESTVIMEYLDDAYPKVPLRPADPKARARVRLWTKKLDEGLHADTSTISTAIAFRHQWTDGRTDDEVKALMDKIPDPARRTRMMELIPKGVEASYFPDAIKRFDKLFAGMEEALAGGDWLAGDAYSLADAAYTPYLTRFDHLGLMGMVEARPRLAAWYERVRERPNYKTAVLDWLNPKYIPLMAEKGAEAWPRVREILAS